ncbi:hypothetical protein HED22_18355 [Thalassospira sp. HF15]|uniref:hypothetical protein n=1 Tax=Thalassospira sp. HF15 TaxID=2722755 RepID=UPI001430B345|nr:hypothetical protein [Thalassospira sp. HF15]NIY77619.1 hypothetical protein [Thalassospira sp. HF15]
MISRHLKIVFLICGVLALGACQTTQEVILSQKSALEMRSIQSRVYDTDDQPKVYRAVLAVMLDLGYAITSVDPEAGVVSGNKLAKLDLTASVAARGEEQSVVRANAVVQTAPNLAPMQVDAPEFYQQRFFEPLSEALFLEAMDEELTAEEEEQLSVDQKTQDSLEQQ